MWSQTLIRDAAKLTSAVRRGKTSSATFVYAIGAVAVALFVLIMFRAASLIHDYNPNVNARLYLITHLLTLACEVVLWFVIARSAVRFKSYALSVREHKDGRALNYVANAVGLGLVYAMLFGIASTVKTLFWRSPHLSLVTDITNLLPILAILSASIYLFIGTQALRQLLVTRKSDVHARQYISLLAVFVIGYGFYFYHAAARLVDDDGLRHFSLSPLTLLFLYVLPYAAAWLLGLLSCMNLARYAHDVHGAIYKSLFHDLYVGVTISFIGMYLAQVFYVSNLSADSFGTGLFFILAIILLLIRGCLLIYSGTNKLYKLED